MRRQDAAVDVRFSREVRDSIDLVVGQERRYELAVADVSVDERVSRVAGDRRQVFEIARVGQLVERHDRQIATGGERVADERRANEAGAASNK